jgi:recombination protein RecR
MKSAEELAEHFKKFPGVGPRQAKRFVYHLLTVARGNAARIADLISALPGETAVCPECKRFFAKDKNNLCPICRDPRRERNTLAIVCRDVDIEAIEKSGSFRGRYFVLGGTIPILDNAPERHVRLKELILMVSKAASSPDNALAEIILATNASPEGDHTADIIKASLAPIAAKSKFRISTLGRGLSTGTELEYADSDTIGNALRNRKDNSR